MGLFDAIGSYFNPQRGYEAAEGVLGQRYPEIQGYLSPFRQQGLDQYGNLQTGISQLMRPEDLMKRFMSSYEESPYAKNLLEANRQSGLDAASSMGLLGSSAAIQNIQKGAGDIEARERENFVRNLMDTYLKGLGLSQGIYNTGFGAAGDMAKAASDMANEQAYLEYNKENSPGNMFQNLLNTGISLFGGKNSPASNISSGISGLFGGR